METKPNCWLPSLCGTAKVSPGWLAYRCAYQHLKYYRSAAPGSKPGENAERCGLVISYRFHAARGNRETARLLQCSVPVLERVLFTGRENHHSHHSSRATSKRLLAST